MVRLHRIIETVSLDEYGRVLGTAASEDPNRLFARMCNRGFKLIASFPKERYPDSKKLTVFGFLQKNMEMADKEAQIKKYRGEVIVTPVLKNVTTPNGRVIKTESRIKSDGSIVTVIPNSETQTL